MGLNAMGLTKVFIPVGMKNLYQNQLMMQCSQSNPHSNKEGLR